MRRTTQYLAALALMLAAPTQAQAAIPADQYQDSIGVNVHTALLTTQHSQYGYGDRIASALEQAGIRHIRDGMTKASPAPHWHWGKLQYVANRVGGGITLILDCKSWYCDYAKPDWNVGQALGWIRTYMPAVEAVEGENEADNTGTGGTGLTSATARQDRIYPAVRSDPWFDGKLVLAPSFITANSYRTVQQADAASCHPYPGGQFDTQQRMSWATTDICGPQAPGKPIVNTEYGYPHTAPNSCVGQRGVTDDEAARWLPAGILNAISLGVPRTFIYELFDSNSCKWGLFTSSGVPRLEVGVLHNWTVLLNDSGSPTRSDTTLTIDDPAGPGKLRTLQFAKSDGSYWVAVWPAVEGAGDRTVTFSRPKGSTWSWQYHQPWKDTAARGYVTRTDRFLVPVGDSPVLVRVRPWD